MMKDSDCENPIGHITACIAGDRRYSSFLDVYMVDRNTVRLVLSETGANGGMDGPGGSTPRHITQALECEAKAGTVVKAMKKMLDRECPRVIKNYGKPSKNFVWLGTTSRGFSQRACQEALDWAPEAYSL